MAKKKSKDSNTIVVNNVQEFLERIEKAKNLMRTGELPFSITGAQIKDDYCNYGFRINSGVGAGDSHKVDGSGIIHDDMREAFAALNVHLALIDDGFGDLEITDPAELTGNDVTTRYHVTGFQFKGHKDAETIVLIGNKYVHSTRGRIELKTPPVSLEDLSGYKFHEKLKEAAQHARNEVALYKEGKYTPSMDVQHEDDNQLEIFNDEPEFDDQLSTAKA